MSSTLLEVLAAHGGVARRAELLAAGTSAGAIRSALTSRALVVVARGVIATRPTWERLEPVDRHVRLLRAVMSGCREGAVVAGLSAAIVWGFPVPPPGPATAEFVVARDAPRSQYGARSSRAAHRRAWLDPDEVTEIGGLLVTSPMRTMVDVARTVPLPWGVAVADAVRARGVSQDDIAAAVRRRPGVPGLRRASRAVSWADARSESPLESVARATVRMLGLPVPEPQVWLTDGGARYRADLVIHEHRTVVEVDGRVKYADGATGAERVWRDKRRRDDVVSWGYEVERFVAADALRPIRWGRSLLRAFHRVAARHGEPPPDIDPAFPEYATYPAAWCITQESPDPPLPRRLGR